MQLAAHELHNIHELTISCVNSITNMICFLNQAEDQQLRSILEKHLPLHIQDYNMKCEFLNTTNGSTQILQVPELNKMLHSFTKSPARGYEPVTPRAKLKTFNDREIATSYLLILKRTGTEYASAAFEVANPELRIFLEDAFRVCSHHAYEIWQWLVQMGYYPLEPASQTQLNIISDFYKEINGQQLIKQ